MRCDQKTFLQTPQCGQVSAECFHIQGAKTWFSEKRSQIEILGLDSLPRQAYNPAPLSQLRDDN